MWRLVFFFFFNAYFTTLQNLSARRWLLTRFIVGIHTSLLTLRKVAGALNKTVINGFAASQSRPQLLGKRFVAQQCIVFLD